MNRIELLKEYISEDTQNPFYFFALAKEYEKESSTDLALEWYEKTRKSFPDYTGLYFHYGSILLEKNDVEKAKKVMEEGLEVCEKEKDLHALKELKGLYIENFGL